MKRVIIYTLFMMLSLNLLAQSDCLKGFTILDSVVVKKCKQDAVKLNLVVLTDCGEDSIRLQYFNRHIVNELGFDNGLHFVVEDENGNVDYQIPTAYNISFVDEESQNVFEESRYVLDEEKLVVKHKRLNDQERKRYNCSALVVCDRYATEVFPVFVNDVKPGKYKLYLQYPCGKNGNMSETEYVTSNKIDLIVKGNLRKYLKKHRK